MWFLADKTWDANWHCPVLRLRLFSCSHSHSKTNLGKFWARFLFWGLQKRRSLIWPSEQQHRIHRIVTRILQNAHRTKVPSIFENTGWCSALTVQIRELQCCRKICKTHKRWLDTFISWEHGSKRKEKRWPLKQRNCFSLTRIAVFCLWWSKSDQWSETTGRTRRHDLRNLQGVFLRTSFFTTCFMGRLTQ